MPLAHILSPPPGPNGLKSWTFAHWQDHQQIVTGLQNQLGIQLNIYVLDPLPTKDTKLWLRRHQFYHNDMNGLLQIQGSDLEGITFDNPEVVRQWMWTNFQEHLSVRALLGI